MTYISISSDDHTMFPNKYHPFPRESVTTMNLLVNAVKIPFRFFRIQIHRLVYENTVNLLSFGLSSPMGIYLDVFADVTVRTFAVCRAYVAESFRVRKCIEPRDFSDIIFIWPPWSSTRSAVWIYDDQKFKTGVFGDAGKF